MNLKDLKYFIADALQRDIESFVAEDHDTLALAVSNGMRSLQRQHDFENCRTYGYVTFNSTTPWQIGTLRDQLLDEEMEVKRWERAYLVNPETNKEVPIRMVGRESLFNTELEAQELRTPTYSQQLEVVRFGRVFYLNKIPEDFPTQVKIRFDVVRWLPELVGDNDSNFITEVAPDVIIYHSLSELNLVLKEDDRAPLSQSFYQARFKSLKDWDADQFANVQQDILLD